MTDAREITWVELIDALSFSGSLATRSRSSGRFAREAWAEVRRRLLQYGVLELNRQSLTSMADLEEIVDDLLLRLTEAQFSAKARKARGHAGYFRMIIRRRLIDRARSERREFLARAEAAELFEGAAFNAADFDDAVRSDEIEAKVKAILEKLEPNERRLLELSFLEMLRPRDIADQLGVSPGTVAVRLHRLLKTLRGSAVADP